MERKIRVLFLPKWYPHRYDPMPGLFVQRQAEALTPYCDVAVIFAHPDPDCPNNYEAEFSEENEVRVLRVYYKIKKRTSLAGKAFNLWKFYRANMKAIHSIRQFDPDLVHAHILTRMGLIGWKVSRKFHIPLVISEHWSRYFPENNSYQGWIRKQLTTFLVKKADTVIAVSTLLREAMRKNNLENRNFQVVPNVVDLDVFRFASAPKSDPLKTMVHISCFEDKSKNISGFLRSIQELSFKRQDFRCLMIGEGPDLEDMMDYAKFLKILDTYVFFMGVKSGPDLAEMISGADFSVLSSRYETFGTVLIESLSCGIPVVATAVGIASEVVNQHTGILVPPGDEPAMTDALDQMIDQCRLFQHENIKEGIPEKFSKETVGRQLLNIYHELLPGFSSNNNS